MAISCKTFPLLEKMDTHQDNLGQLASHPIKSIPAAGDDFQMVYQVAELIQNTHLSRIHTKLFIIIIWYHFPLDLLMIQDFLVLLNSSSWLTFKNWWHDLHILFDNVSKMQYFPSPSHYILWSFPIISSSPLISIIIMQHVISWRYPLKLRLSQFQMDNGIS